MIGEILNSGSTVEYRRTAINNSYSGTAIFNNVNSEGYLSGSTLYSGITNIMTIFSLSGIGTSVQSTQSGANILTGGSFSTPIITTNNNPVFNKITISGATPVNIVSLSGYSISGNTIKINNFIYSPIIISDAFSGLNSYFLTANTNTLFGNNLNISTNFINGALSATTFFSGVTNINNIIFSSNTQFWSSGTLSNSVIRKNLSNSATATNTIALGNDSHATSANSIAFGQQTYSNGLASFVIGKLTTAGDYSHSEGINSLTVSNSSHAEGDSQVTLDFSHVGGNCSAGGSYSSWSRSNFLSAGQYLIQSSSATTTGTVPDGLSANFNSILNLGVDKCIRVNCSVLAVNTANLNCKEWGGFGLAKYRASGSTISFVGGSLQQSINTTFADAGMASAKAELKIDSLNLGVYVAITGITSTAIEWFSKIDAVIC